MKELIIKELVKTVKEIAGDGYLVTFREVKKNNGTDLHALIVRMPNDVISPVVYVDKFVEEIARNSMTVIEAAQKVFDTYNKCKNEKLEIDVKKFIDKDYILQHVEYQLVNAEKNKEMLKKIPGKKVIDLVAVYRIVVNSGEGITESYILDSKQLEMIGINIDELDKAAMKNTQKSEFLIRTIDQVISEMMGMDEELTGVIAHEPKMFVLTNKRKIYGANILLCKEELAGLADKIQDDFYILPSSIHELIAIPVKDVEVEPLKKMVKEVNDNEVEIEEILGYEVYKYNRETGKITIAV